MTDAPVPPSSSPASSPTEPRTRRLVLVTGMSGAGKSTVLDLLEDLGWDCVDNLPLGLLSDYVEACAPGAAPMAVAMDVRSRGFDADQLVQVLAGLPVKTELLFLDCTGAELARRFDKSRRRHPLAPDRPVEDGIGRERNLLARLRLNADRVIETTELSPVEMREELRRAYGEDVHHPMLTIGSFGFGRGIMRAADLVFDMRFIDNPHWVPELREMTGEEPTIQAYVANDPAWTPTLDRIESLLIDLIPRYWAAGKYYLCVGFGCTGGRHRSVAAAEEMAKRLRRRGFESVLRHRDLATRPSDAIEDDKGGPPKRAE